MGHLRVGRLPKTMRWSAVVGLLDAPDVDSFDVARATVAAAEERLRGLASDPSLAYCFWLLARITWAARGPNFTAMLGDLGIDARPDDSALTFISRVTDRAREVVTRFPESGHFSELASLALRRALSETVGQQNLSLFGSSVEQLQEACRAYSARAQFGVLAQRFFGDFLARTLRSLVEKELSHHTGSGQGLPSVVESQRFSESLDLHARQSARIMGEFAAGWYSKHNWESQGQISREEAQGFAAVALRKLRMELKREQVPL